MKKILVIAIVAIFMGSCARNVIIPKAVNTVSTASYSDLNLNRADYEVINSISVDAAINCIVSSRGKVVDVNGLNDNFSLHYVYVGFNKKKGPASGWMCTFTGLMKLGFLGKDYVDDYDPSTMYAPEILARRLAIYRAINMVKQEGGDGMIEPTISTNIEQIGNTITYKSTVTAKIIKIKTDNELKR